MKNHALLIELDSVRHLFAIFKAIVQKYEKCKIFYLGDSTAPIFDAEEIIAMLTEYMRIIDIEINDKNTSEKDRQECKQTQKEINRICTNIGIINNEYIRFKKERLAIDIIEVKQLDDQALAILWYVAFSAIWGDWAFLIAPLNTSHNKAIKYYIEDFDNAGQRAINDNDENFAKTRIKDFMQAIKSLSNDLEFVFLTQLWGEYNRTALFSCADKNIFEDIKNLPKNHNQMLDYQDKILLNACPCDGVYIGSYTQQ
ncbi:MAG: hypothetical protein IKI11_10485 [Neisseriaceae bacterium]|nr:hypothetical protein [Neisseriaceae bacterium]